MAYKGVDIRATGDRIVFRAYLVDSLGAIVTTGTTNLRMYRLETDGTLASYDWNDDTFKTTALTTQDQALTHRTGNNGTTNTGLWTFSLTTLTGFSSGDVILAQVTNTAASPATQTRLFQFGDAEGDLTVTTNRLNTNLVAANDDANAGARLAAALTTANGIDVNMGQVTPGSPTVDTTGEALRFAHQGLPDQIAAGASGGLRITQNVELFQLNFTIDTGSTASSIVVPTAQFPAGTQDDDYNDYFLYIKDVSADRFIRRRVIDTVAATRTLILDTALPFTPEVSVDIATLWGTPDAAVIAELVKVTGGFGTASPNNLIGHVRAMTDKTATVPSGLGTYSATTDSLEAARDLMDAMAGGGFLTGTDSLQAIRDAIDTLLAPAVVTSSALSGSGFLSDCVSFIRKSIDEPNVSPKYTDSNIVEYVQMAVDEVLSDLNINTDHPLLVRFPLPLVSGTQVYTLPPNVGQIWRIARINEPTGIPETEVWPGSEFEFTGYGYQIEGNQLRFMSIPQSKEDLNVLYVPMGETFIHKATATAATATTITFPTSVTDGTLDTRENAYAGYVLRILSSDTTIVQERTISAYDNETRIATVSVAFDPTPAGTIVYEVLPWYSRILKHAVILKASCQILSNEGSRKKRQELEHQLRQRVRGLRLIIETKNARFPKRWDGNTVDNAERQLWTGGAGVVW